MTNNKLTKKSKWLKLALISTASLTTLASIPAAICAKATVKTSTPNSKTKLEAATYVKLVFKLREADIKAGATISGQTVTKITKGDYFGSVKKPKINRDGYQFLGWSTDTEGTGNIVSNDDPINTATTVYAVFSQVKMVLNFPESTDGDFQWKYETGAVQVPFNKGDKFGAVNPPVPKWTHSDKKMVWDGKWWDKPQTEKTTRTQLSKDTVLTGYDNKSIYPGWLDEAVVSITVTGPNTISIGEKNIDGANNLKYDAKAFPETAPQDVDWHTRDAVDTLTESNFIQISDKGVLSFKPDVTITSGQKVYVYALEQSAPLPETIDPKASNVIEVTLLDPTEDPRFADQIITTLNQDGVQYTCAVDPDEFYKLDEDENKIIGIELGETREGQTISENRTSFNHSIAFGNNVTQIKDGFMPSKYTEDEEGGMVPSNGFASFNSTIELNNVISIGDDFLSGNIYYSNGVEATPLDLSTVTSIGDNFLSDCTNFMVEVILGDEIEHIGDDFMRGCTEFAEEITLPKSLHHIGKNFMYNCTSQHAISIYCAASSFVDSNASFAIDYVADEFETHEIEVKVGDEAILSELITQFPKEIGTQDGDLVRSLKEALDWDKGQAAILDDDGYHYCEDLQTSKICAESGAIKTIDKSYERATFNLPLAINPNIETIPECFLFGCGGFNQDLVIPEGVKQIDKRFLLNCTSFNSQLTIPSTLKSIPVSFLQGCMTFDKPLDLSHITLEEGHKKISDNFLQFCYKFNSEIKFPSGITSIGNNFMHSCRKFNKTLEIPTTVTEIGTSFLYSCYEFNQPLTIPSSVTKIGNGFLQYCSAFNKNLTISANVTSVGTHFLAYCDNMLSTLTINCAVTAFEESVYTCCASKGNVQSFIQGMKIDGDNAAAFKEKFSYGNPDSDIGITYRKLVLAASFDFVGDTPIVIKPKCVEGTTISLEAFNIGSSASPMHIQKEGATQNIKPLIDSGAARLNYKIASSEPTTSLDESKFHIEWADGSTSNFYISVDAGGITTSSQFTPGTSHVELQLEITTSAGTRMALSERIYIRVAE